MRCLYEQRPIDSIRSCAPIPLWRKRKLSDIVLRFHRNLTFQGADDSLQKMVNTEPDHYGDLIVEKSSILIQRIKRCYYFRGRGMSMRKTRLGACVAALIASGVAAQHADAACTVPNALTNGQVADATQLMANFTALNTCINGAPAGSNNAIQYNAGSGAFGGVGPLTNGQIVIGTTGGAPAAANLTPGAGISITNAPGSVTISTTAAAAPGLYDISVGVPTTFTPINIGGNGAVTTNGSKAITITAGSSAPSTPTIYGVAVPVPATTPYMVAILVLPNAPIKYTGPAFGYYDSTTGKLITLISLNGSSYGYPGYSFQTWNTPSSRTSYNEPSIPRAANFGPTWFGIKDDGTTISFYSSQDGANFYPLGFSQVKSGGFLSAYDHIFIGMFSDAESGSDGAVANENVSVTYLAYDPNGLTRTAGP